mgnify:CR=1 FL=1
MVKHILTKEQREAGLRTWEDDHNIIIYDTNIKRVAVFGTHATIQEIQKAANDYLAERP